MILYETPRKQLTTRPRRDNVRVRVFGSRILLQLKLQGRRRQNDFVLTRSLVSRIFRWRVLLGLVVTEVRSPTPETFFIIFSFAYQFIK